jgi:FKBP-type peptidyl-prolyl cis-trans isomerase
MEKKYLLALIILVVVIGIIVYSLNLKDNKMTENTNQNQQNQEEQTPEEQIQENQNQEQPQQQATIFDIQGMTVEVLKEGSGEPAKTGDTVSVHYVGTLENGTKFDSSVDRGEQFPFTLGENRVIQGWELGVLGMKVGEKRKLTIPADLAYGDRAVGNLIPANATLVFEVELFGIN